MKYQVGDIVKIKKMNYNDYVIFRDKVGIILGTTDPVYDIAKATKYPVVIYQVLVAGIEGKKHLVYEEEIEYKIKENIE